MHHVTQAALPFEHMESVVPDAYGSAVLQPFDYQEEALEATLAAHAAGLRRLLVAMPTGSGKTVYVAWLIRRLGWERAAIMVHRDELVQQTLNKLGMVLPGAPVGVVKAEQDQVHFPIVVASAQTLARPTRLQRLQEALRDRGRLLFISDECHHDMSQTREHIIRELAPDLLVGVTATPERGDGKGLGAIYEKIVYSLAMLDLIARGRLANLRGVRIGTDVALDAVHIRGGEFVESELSDAVDTPERNRLVVEGWQRHAAGRTRTAVFAVDVAHAYHLRDAFREAGVRAEAILGTTPQEERRSLLREFHDGTLPVLCNVLVLSEGYDEPQMDCLIMARPTKSRTLFIQCVGRAARAWPGKEDALILDVVDVTARHTLITLPALLDDPEDATAVPRDQRDNDEVSDLLELGKGRAEVKAALAKRSHEVDLFGRSPFLWRQVAGAWMADAGFNRWLVLREEQDGYRPFVLARNVGTRGATLRPQFPRPVDLGYAMGLAERALEVTAEVSRLVHREAAWRTRAAPATEKQLDLMRMMRIKRQPSITRAEASLLIGDEMFRRSLREAVYVV